MDILTKTPGFHYVAENIFINLDFEDLENCSQVNKSWRKILNNPSFWLRKLIQFGVLENKEYQSSWKIVIQLQNQIFIDSNFEENNKITQHLKKICLKDELKNPDSKSAQKAAEKKRKIQEETEKLCQIKEINEKIQSQFREEIVVLGTKKRRITGQDRRNVRARIQQEIVTKYLKPTNSKKPESKPNNNRKIEPSELGDEKNPIHWAATNGYTDVVKILAPISAFPNAPDSFGWSPVFTAAYFGHDDIIKVLAPFLPENFLYANSKHNFGICPLYMAAKKGHVNVVKTILKLPGINTLISRKNPIIKAAENGLLEVIKLLAPLMKKSSLSPNFPNSHGQTPIYLAAEKGHVEIVKYLAPYSENPNAPTDNGDTPINVAATNYDLKRDEIIQFLLPFVNNNNNQ